MTSLLESYKNTRYKVFETNITIEIGKPNKELNELLLKYNSIEWAFITAYNPFSKILTSDENKLRHNELKELTRNFVTYEGQGVGEDPNWEPEISLLNIGISKEESINIGNKFEQNAIVFGELNNSPELIILNEEFI